MPETGLIVTVRSAPVPSIRILLDGTSVSLLELADKVRLAAFISGIGVTTGALAGGLESRKLIQHLSLFDSEP